MIINDINKLSKIMQPKAKLFLEEAKKVRNDIVIFETLRTKQRQIDLFNAGFSWTLKSFHLTGDAFDICFYKDEIYTWSASSEEWKKLIQIGKDCELDNLYPYEYGHFQNNFKPLNIMLYEKEIENDYTPLSETRMKMIAEEWSKTSKTGDELIAFEAGKIIKTQPKTYKDLKDSIVIGRLVLMIKKLTNGKF